MTRREYQKLQQLMRYNRIDEQDLPGGYVLMRFPTWGNDYTVQVLNLNVPSKRSAVRTCRLLYKQAKRHNDRWGMETFLQQARDLRANR